MLLVVEYFSLNIRPSHLADWFFGILSVGVGTCVTRLGNWVFGIPLAVIRSIYPYCI